MSKPLQPPPVSQPIVDPATGLPSRAMVLFFNAMYEKLGKAVSPADMDVAGTSGNITGILASANASFNLIKNGSNDATVDSIDAGSDATVRVYGSGGVGSNWSRIRNAVVVATHPALTFTGKAFNTRYYIGFDIVTGQATISTAYKDVTGDNMVIFSVLTVADGGGGGASGGGGAGSGGSGGVGGGGGGYGMLQ